MNKAQIFETLICNKDSAFRRINVKTQTSILDEIGLVVGCAMTLHTNQMGLAIKSETDSIRCIEATLKMSITDLTPPTTLSNPTHSKRYE